MRLGTCTTQTGRRFPLLKVQGQGRQDNSLELFVDCAWELHHPLGGKHLVFHDGRVACLLDDEPDERRAKLIG